MDLDELRARRLHAQGLTGAGPTSAVEVVRRLGAVQAQELPGGLWAIGQRTDRPARSDVGGALDHGDLLRAHVLRPTWHITAGEDLAWLQQLTGPRVERAVGSYYRAHGLDADELRHADATIDAALRGGRSLTRPELVAALNAAGIDTAHPVRLAHLTLHAEAVGLLCSGPARGGRETYALLRERAAPTLHAIGDIAARDELARRYFRTRGPATARDFAWWSGMTLGATRAAIDSLDDELTVDTFAGTDYWSSTVHRRTEVTLPDELLLLPAYDEYLISYADRGAHLDPGLSLESRGRRNPVFDRTVVHRGLVVGTWSIDRRTGRVEPGFPSQPSAARLRAFTTAVDRYQDFSRS